MVHQQKYWVSSLLSWLVLVGVYSRKTHSNISMMILLWENHNYKNRAGVIDEGPTHGKAHVNPEHGQIFIQQSGTTDNKQKLRLGSLNIATMRDCTGKVKR